MNNNPIDQHVLVDGNNLSQIQRNLQYTVNFWDSARRTCREISSVWSLMATYIYSGAYLNTHRLTLLALHW